MHRTETHIARNEPAVAGFKRRSDAARQVADLIRSDIHSGRLHGPLPFEWELLDLYGSTRNALRDALRLLSQQGLVVRTPGTGTVTVDAGVFITMERTTRAFTIHDDAAQTDPDGPEGDAINGSSLISSRILTRQARVAPECVSHNLGLARGGKVVFIDSLISVGGVPNRLRTSWLPYELGEMLLDDTVDGYVPSLLETQLQQAIHPDRLLIEAVNADQWSAELLEIPVGAALLLCERVMVSPQGDRVEFGFSRHRGDRSIFDSRTWRGPLAPAEPPLAS